MVSPLRFLPNPRYFSPNQNHTFLVLSHLKINRCQKKKTRKNRKSKKKKKRKTKHKKHIDTDTHKEM